MAYNGFVMGTTTVGGTDGGRITVWKQDPANGNLLWVQQPLPGTSGFDNRGQSLSLDGPTGTHLYLAGRFINTLTFNPGKAVTSNGNRDIFVAKLKRSDGTCEWAKSWGGSGADEGNGVWTAGGDAVYLSGLWSTTVNWAGLVTTTSAGSTDMFFGTVDPATGNLLSIGTFGSTQYDVALSIARDQFNVPYVTGAWGGRRARAASRGRRWTLS